MGRMKLLVKFMKLSAEKHAVWCSGPHVPDKGAGIHIRDGAGYRYGWRGGSRDRGDAVVSSILGWGPAGRQEQGRPCVLA